jgi:hypothetical protein
MTRSQRASDRKPAAQPDGWRNRMSAGLGNLAALGARPWSEVAEIEIFPGVRLGDPVIVLPEDWMPAGGTQRLSFRTIDPSLDGSLHVGTPEQVAARDESVRRAMLMLWLPRLTQTGVRRYKPVPWVHAVQLLLRCVQWQISHRPSQDGSVWSHLVAQDFDDMQRGVTENDHARQWILRIVGWLADAGMRGVLTDYPHIRVEDQDAAEPVSEKSPRGDAPERKTKLAERQWQPFPDEFVTELIWRALWIQENLARPLLECSSGLRRIAARREAEGRSTSHPSVIAERNAFIADFNWRDAKGKRLTKLPFEISQRTKDGFTLTSSWPPRDSRSIDLALSVLQVCNLSVIGLCTGARISEISAANENSLEAAMTEGRLRSRSFKLVSTIGGAERDWPLHPAAVRALELQVDFARRVRPEGMTHLWCKIHGGEALLNMTEPMVKAVDHLGLTHLAGRDRPHFHRWRETVARLVALAVTGGGPQVLMGLFGHKSLEMTIRYILSHPEILQDALRIAREMNFALSVEAIQDALMDMAGGPAAPLLKAGIEERRMRRGEEAYGAETLAELAEVLTFHGRSWDLVRPGVICTKIAGQVGPCNRGRGVPDPGACRTSCTHRLETARARRDCEEALDALLRERESAEAGGLAMLCANLDGQIVANLKRWPDVRERALARSARARSLWEDASAAA